MSSAHLSELRLSLFVLKFIFDVQFSELCPSAHIAEGIGLSFQMGTFRNVGLFIPTGCRGPPQSIVLSTQNRLIGGIYGEICTEESVRFGWKNLPGAQLCRVSSTGRYIPWQAVYPSARYVDGSSRGRVQNVLLGQTPSEILEGTLKR